ncbi:X-Pro aminopeptidase [Hyphomicrobium methylovorum]|uniref:aminopeptidase P family protein n=1 Tax=Hyphomicrobium methylovorum TaxID=84 RepID=UPI0015E781E1|nr:aminopeptidase P family protein [Hyphomicrobium methylovorum]MBA2126570.1 X-Pro aminopeptidase [Hyphomicrobium methylovorum]
MFQTFQSQSNPENVAARVKALRALMAKAKLDAVLIPRADKHQGEYVPASDERLQWISGFSGSAGLAVVTRKSAMLMIDGRYTVQAAAETDKSVFEVSLLPRAKLGEWLSSALGKGHTVGFDPWTHTGGEIARLKTALSSKNIKLKPLPKNPIDTLWGKARPKPPANPVIAQPLEFTGKSAADKIASIQARLKSEGQAAVILTLPDSICWLFNIRGSDVAHNPVALAFAIVPASGKAELFIDAERVDAEARTSLAKVAKLLPPKTMKERLASLKSQGKRVRLDPETASAWFELKLGPAAIARGQDPCILPKAIKTEAEIDGARSAHERDGAAVVRFLAWLDDTAPKGELDEITAVKKLEDFRRDTNMLREISFATISGAGSNGAIVHYRVSEATNRTVTPGELFLIDSGGQYQDGTTDITRTVAVGEPNQNMKRHFTAVLKGHIAVATARFPKGTRGIDLDPFARRALWSIGEDFDHGTGHGIGSYLSVHEGPQSISRGGMTPLEPGMLISNEPGFYKVGAYGIRIENVVLVTPAEKIGDGERPMMALETLTLAPIDRRLIDVEMLETIEREWLDAYHRRVFETLSGKLDAHDRAWLKQATKPL